jgi:hypothetical protein
MAKKMRKTIMNGTAAVDTHCFAPSVLRWDSDTTIGRGEATLGNLGELMFAPAAAEVPGADFSPDVAQPSKMDARVSSNTGTDLRLTLTCGAAASALWASFAEAVPLASEALMLPACMSETSSLS